MGYKDWKKPICPGCKHEMQLGYERWAVPPPWLPKRRQYYAAWYSCNHCGVWRTSAVISTVLNNAIEQAHKEATKRG